MHEDMMQISRDKNDRMAIRYVKFTTIPKCHNKEMRRSYRKQLILNYTAPNFYKSIFTINYSRNFQFRSSSVHCTTSLGFLNGVNNGGHVMVEV